VANVNRASPEDLDAVWEVDRLAFDDPHEREALRDTIAQGECWVARIDESVVGFATFGRFLHGHGFLRVIAVHPDHRRQGVATALVRHLETISPTDRLFTSTTRSNVAMQQLCEALGFAPSGYIEGLEDGEVELIYSKLLPRAPGRDGTILG
jgi:ribosomal protein S18 acetylase RimI-like enzyme